VNQNFTTLTPSTMKKIHPNFNTNKELGEYLLNCVGSTLKQAIKVTVETLLKAEMAQLREELQEKTEEREKLYFNGYYPRHLVSPLGQVRDVAVPRLRGGNEEADLKGLGLFEGEKERFYELLAGLHLRGLSQGKVRQLCDEYFGQRVSKKKVGEVYAELVEKEEYRINEQPLDDDFVFLLVDGIWEKVRSLRLDGETNKMVLLCVLGIRKDGSRKILGFRMGKQEDHKSWLKLLESVKGRGLKGGNLQLIISDGAEGGLNALDEIYPDVKIQLCLSHKARNVISKANHKCKKEVGADFSAIYNAENFEEAKKLCAEFEKKWFVRAEACVRSLKHRFGMYFTFFEFPRELWKVIRTTNILEREFREVRRRTRVFDNYFQSPESADRYHNGIFTYLNNHYPRKNSLTPLFEKITH